MADPLDSQNIARHSFGVGRRGYEQQEVRAFLHEVSALVERLQRELHEHRQRADRAEARLGLSSEPDDAMLLEVLGEARAGALDRFDRAQLAEVIRVCQKARSLSEAGRLLFAASRAKKSSVNDADRLRKYLARFELGWSDLAQG